MSPRVVCPAFLDPSNTASAIAASPSRQINTYLEGVAPGHGKSPVWWVSRPGVAPFATLPDGPGRGVFTVNDATTVAVDRVFAVGGPTFCELLADGTVIHVNTIANDDAPVSFATNGSAGYQLLIVSASLGYIYDLNANTLTQITDPNFPSYVRACEFLDGYFIVLAGPSTRRVQWSALEDGTSWAALDFLEVSESADNLTAIIRSHRELWCLGLQTTTVLYDVGDGNTVLAPLQGVLLEQGCQGSHAVVRADNTIVWVTHGADGQGMVMRADGYTPKRISTHAVEYDLQQAAPADFVTCAFQFNGHWFVCLTLPDLELSWVYDLTTDRWFEWGHWDSTNLIWVPFLANDHTFGFNRHLIASRVDATVYHLSAVYLSDAITALS